MESKKKWDELVLGRTVMNLPGDVPRLPVMKSPEVQVLNGRTFGSGFDSASAVSSASEARIALERVASVGSDASSVSPELLGPAHRCLGQERSQAQPQGRS